MIYATLKKPKSFAPRHGHPWIYRSQIDQIQGNPQPGDLVHIKSNAGKPMGIGYINPNSEITIRILSASGEAIDRAFFENKIKKAVSYRKKFVRDSNAFRLISSEADGLPGLIVDQYGEVLVVQFLTFGIQKQREIILDVIQQMVPNRGIFEKSDSSSRVREGLEVKVGWIQKSCDDPVQIFEGAVKFEISFGEGHKTGFYLDQRDNRLFLAGLFKNIRVLDAFSYTGGFGIGLAKAGCKVLSLDSQKDVIQRAIQNQKLNQISNEFLNFEEANVFDHLRVLENKKERFDLVILDPPSFVKNKAAIQGAMAGYKELALRSMKLLNEDGYLAIFSCSYHVDENMLMQTCLSAAWDTRKRLRLVKFMQQSSDHPIDPLIPETYYLKGFLFQVAS